MITHDAIGCTEAQYDGVRSEEHRREMARSLIRRLEVNLLTSASREHAPQFEPDEQAAEREEEAENP